MQRIDTGNKTGLWLVRVQTDDFPTQVSELGFENRPTGRMFHRLCRRNEVCLGFEQRRSFRSGTGR
jgi:hypothetical protein